ncbi:hypothetical protein GCE9029_01179 [Grimontia celer]|uniref:Uncharacterized protein n=1 Tax=Grimontia celer TaxID=1796497 RepID=A0A128EWL2_9GAMM|nr:hypothetical protein [Grimontia celer]CZF78982.1 hypothetical protein GCE9029_01179 [Grimontia celer]
MFTKEEMDKLAKAHGSSKRKHEADNKADRQKVIDYMNKFCDQDTIDKFMPLLK